MSIDRYDHYGPPRLSVAETGVYLIRDVLNASGYFAGICEYAHYDFDGEIRWTICNEGVDFSDIRPLVQPSKVDGK